MGREKIAITAQEVFDKTYIASSEICRRLDITRGTIVRARQRGNLPEPIEVNGGQVFLWERRIVEPYISAWSTMLRARRGAANA